MSIVYQLGKTVADIIKTLLAESRKTNIDVFVGSHSERVKALGIEGEGDLKEGFVMVRLTINKMTKERKATIDYGDGALPAILPGPFFVGNDQHVLETDEYINLEVEPTPAEAEILRLKAEGKSDREVSQVIWGEGKYGKFYNDKIRNVVDRFGE